MVQIHIDKNMGISDDDRVYWMRSKHGEEYWCRKRIFFAFCDTTQSDGLSPFDPNFRDNYVQGKGKTKEEALENMAKEESNIANSFWVI